MNQERYLIYYIPIEAVISEGNKKVVTTKNKFKDFKNYIVNEFCREDNNVYKEDCITWLEGIKTIKELKKMMLEQGIVTGIKKI